LTKHTYTIPGPQLEPKESKFAGYEQPYSKIHYELDFSRGAQVDIGCGTAVVGDGSRDANIPKDVYAHPASMHEMSYAHTNGRGNPNSDPPDPGYYPMRCPRYHRFAVTKPGNFTFDSCASLMNVGVSLFKRTDNLNDSEYGRTPDGSWKPGRLYEVPLHDNDKQWSTVPTGTISGAPEFMPCSMNVWVHRVEIPAQ